MTKSSKSQKNKKNRSRFNNFPKGAKSSISYDMRVGLEHISRTQRRDSGRAVTEAQIRKFTEMPIFESTIKNWERAAEEGYLEIFHETYFLTPKGIEVTTPERNFGGYFNNLSDAQKERVREKTARAIKDTKRAINMDDNPLLKSIAQNYGGQIQNA